MRLWSVIQRLTQRKEAKMTDREEAVFGEVYQEFKRIEGKSYPGTDAESMGFNVVELRTALIDEAARSLRALYDLEKR